MMNRMINKYQKSFTKILRNTNKSLKEDELWKGRFYILQRGRHWIEFPDQSGGTLIINLRIYDRKTGIYWDYIFDYAPYYATTWYRLNFDLLNDFIINKVDVWKEKPKPTLDSAIDYTNTPYKQNDKRKERY